MTEDEAKQQLSMLTLPPGFTGSVVTDDILGVYVQVQGPNKWVCQYTEPDQTLWAQQQINAASQ